VFSATAIKELYSNEIDVAPCRMAACH